MFVANTRMKDFPKVATTFWAIEHSGGGSSARRFPVVDFKTGRFSN